MKLNLRKARKLEQAITKAIESLMAHPTCDVRVMASEQDRLSFLKEKRESFLANRTLRCDLVKARFEIRKMIGQCNQDAGLSNLMCKREELQDLLKIVSLETTVLDLAHLSDQVTAKKVVLEKGESRYDSGVTVATSVLTEDDCNEIKKQTSGLKREIEKLEDELSQLNLGAKITLCDELVTLLSSQDLI
jgi:hypothetical protein